MRLILLLLLFPASCLAADPWSHGDVAREFAYQSISLIDWSQTRWIARNATIETSVTVISPSNPNVTFQQITIIHASEINPILGEHPSVVSVNRYFFLTGLVHIGISHILPSNYRSIWQYMTIGIEAGMVNRNINVGIKYSWP